MGQSSRHHGARVWAGPGEEVGSRTGTELGEDHRSGSPASGPPTWPSAVTGAANAGPGLSSPL